MGKLMDLVDTIINYESGGLSRVELIEFFQELVDTGAVNNLQGHYQRMAQTLMDEGFITNG